MAERRKAKRTPEPPAVVAARKNRKLMAQVRQSIRDIVAGVPGIPGEVVVEEARRRHERLQP